MNLAVERATFMKQRFIAILLLQACCHLFCSQALADEPQLPLNSHPKTNEESGWHALFANDLSNAIFTPDSWVIEDGILIKKGDGFIWTKEKYGDFILDLEFKINEGGNSGVFLRAGDTVEWLHTSIEIDINDSYGDHPRYKGICGAVYDCVIPTKNMIKSPGQWNRYTIACSANKINVVFNGEPIVDMDLNRWTEPHKNPDGTLNKFKTAYKDMPRVGPIGIQDHGDPVWLRNIRIKLLKP